MKRWVAHRESSDKIGPGARRARPGLAIYIGDFYNLPSSCRHALLTSDLEPHGERFDTAKVTTPTLRSDISCSKTNTSSRPRLPLWSIAAIVKPKAMTSGGATGRGARQRLTRPTALQNRGPPRGPGPARPAARSPPPAHSRPARPRPGGPDRSRGPRGAAAPARCGPSRRPLTGSRRLAAPSRLAGHRPDHPFPPGRAASTTPPRRPSGAPAALTRPRRTCCRRAGGRRRGREERPGPSPFPPRPAVTAEAWGGGAAGVGRAAGRCPWRAAPLGPAGGSGVLSGPGGSEGKGAAGSPGPSPAAAGAARSTVRVGRMGWGGRERNLRKRCCCLGNRGENMGEETVLQWEVGCYHINIPLWSTASSFGHLVSQWEAALRGKWVGN